MARGPERRSPSTAEEVASGRPRRKSERMSAGESTSGKGKYYMISVVAQNYGIHPQTLRLYEREGLLKPSRTEGNTRLYSEDDLRQLEVILNLTRDLGVNLAGVEIVLNMRHKMERMQTEMNDFMNWVREELTQANLEGWQERYQQALVRLPSTHIVRSPTEDKGR
jgi:MerR family transcriptional regulator, heat shock protein HspR